MNLKEKISKVLTVIIMFPNYPLILLLSIYNAKTKNRYLYSKHLMYGISSMLYGYLIGWLIKIIVK